MRSNVTSSSAGICLLPFRPRFGIHSPSELDGRAVLWLHSPGVRFAVTGVSGICARNLSRSLFQVSTKIPVLSLRYQGRQLNSFGPWIWNDCSLLVLIPSEALEREGTEHSLPLSLVEFHWMLQFGNCSSNIFHSISPFFAAQTVDWDILATPSSSNTGFPLS